MFLASSNQNTARFGVSTSDLYRCIFTTLLLNDLILPHQTAHPDGASPHPQGAFFIVRTAETTQPWQRKCKNMSVRCNATSDMLRINLCEYHSAESRIRRHFFILAETVFCTVERH
jgi:hypothetical protein